MGPSITAMSRALIAASLAIASSVLAQAEVKGNPPEPVAASASRPVGEYWAARLRWGIAYRSGGQQDLGPDLTYSGITPNDFSGQLWGWWKWFGAYAVVQREGFALFDGANPTAVTAGGLWRAGGQLAGRIPLGPVRIEPYVGYTWQQLPTFRGPTGATTSLMPEFGAASRHGLWFAARLMLEVSLLTIEARGELPYSLGVAVPGAARATTFGFAAGGAVRVQLPVTTGNLNLGVVVDGQYVFDDVTGFDAMDGVVVASQQRIIRGGVGLDVMWKEPPPARPRFGGVVVRVSDVDSGAALPGADVRIAVDGEQRPLAPDAAGALALRELEPGPITVRATADGYLPFEGAAAITAGVDTPLDVKLKKEPPKVGGLAIAVTELDSKKPLSGVTVTIGEASTKTNEAGVAKFEGLKPGPAAVSFTLDGYQKGEEAASVVANRTTDVAVTLVPLKKRVPATITGLVRSTRGGTPIAADLEIPQLKLKTKADGKGAFTFRVDGGTYTVRISAPGYLTQTKDVTVKDGDQAIFNVDLHPR